MSTNNEQRLQQQNDELMMRLAEANKKLAQHEKTAKSRYIDLCVDDEVTDQIERLRAFCSLSMNHNGEDWLYCEQFFDEILALLAKAKEDGRAEAQARIKVLEDALRFYAPEKVSVEHGFGISQRMDDGTIAQQALSTTSPTEVLDKVVREAEIRVLEEFGEKSGFGSSTLLQMIADRKAIRRIEP